MSTCNYRGVKYLGGIPSFPRKVRCKVVIDEVGILLSSWGRKGYIAIENIANLQIVPYTEFDPAGVSNKSVVGRAAVGGLLLGPLGMVVGGMSGLGQKQKLTTQQRIHKNDYVLLIEGMEHGLSFRCGFVFPALLMKERAASKPLEQIQQMRVLHAQRQATSKPPALINAPHRCHCPGTCNRVQGRGEKR